MRGIRKDNRGYSLVEMIIVVAIIAVVGLGATWSIILVFSGNAKACANAMVNSISECKVMTMSQGRGNVRVIIYRGSNGNIYSELQTRESVSAGWVTGKDGAEKIGANRCYVGTTDGGNEIPDRDNAWEIYFDRSSGSFLYSAEANTSVTEIYVMGGRKNYRITLQKLTGKTILELL